MEANNDLGGQQHGVLRLVRVSAVPAHAMNRDVHRIHIGQGIADSVTYSPGGQFSVIVQRQTKTRARESCEQAICQHGPRAAATFLGGLADDDQSSAPKILQMGKHTRGAEHTGHVHVVAAGVHHRNVLAILILGHRRAGVR